LSDAVSTPNTPSPKGTKPDSKSLKTDHKMVSTNQPPPNKLGDTKPPQLV